MQVVRCTFACSPLALLLTARGAVRPSRARLRRRHPRRHDLRRQRRRALRRRRRRRGRPDRRGRRARIAGTAARPRSTPRGLAVAPGFINMLSWATESLIDDGRGQSDIRQGVTLEVMGEGWSMGPLNPSHEGRRSIEQQGDIRYPISLDHAGRVSGACSSRRGISPNVASFVGATTVRVHELGEDDVDPTRRAAGADARAGAPGDGRGRDGRRLVADLRAGLLRRDDELVALGDRGGAVRRHVHQPHAQRGRPRSARRSTS